MSPLRTGRVFGRDPPEVGDEQPFEWARRLVIAIVAACYRRQAGRWLAERDHVKAADELLAAAADAAPAERVVAVDVVAGLGHPAMPAWQRALDYPTLAPHARALLADPEDSADAGDLPESDAADRRWLAVEYALVALAADGPDEAYHLLRDLDGLDRWLTAATPTPRP